MSAQTAWVEADLEFHLYEPTFYFTISIVPRSGIALSVPPIQRSCQPSGISPSTAGAAKPAVGTPAIVEKELPGRDEFGLGVRGNGKGLVFASPDGIVERDVE